MNAAGGGEEGLSCVSLVCGNHNERSFGTCPVALSIKLLDGTTYVLLPFLEITLCPPSLGSTATTPTSASDDHREG